MMTQLLKNVNYFNMITGYVSLFPACVPVRIRLSDLFHQFPVRHDLQGFPPGLHVFGYDFMDDGFELPHRQVALLPLIGQAGLSCGSFINPI